MKEDILKLVVDVAADMNATLPRPVVVERGAEAPLYGGSEGVLDSLALVRMIVEVEAAVDERFGVPVTLADDRAMSQRRSPFRTLGSLAEHVAAAIDAAKTPGQS